MVSLSYLAFALLHFPHMKDQFYCHSLGGSHQRRSPDFTHNYNLQPEYNTSLPQ
jgi:hypothetical protein